MAYCIVPLRNEENQNEETQNEEIQTKNSKIFKKPGELIKIR